MSNITIKETFTLPSLGKVYLKQFDPNITLRSMTVAEEMKRLSATDQPYRAMCDIIGDCIIGEAPMSVYDMCLGDYLFLLHKLRVVTYGPDYKINIRCPYCGNVIKDTLDLDKLGVNTYDLSIESLFTLSLPVTGDTLTLKLQTPRDLDYIEQRKRELNKLNPDSTEDPTLLLNILTAVTAINGEHKIPLIVEAYVRNLPLRDYQVIVNRIEELNKKVGIDINIASFCKKCKNDVNTTFRFTSEFFRPTFD